jgi:glutamate N-acetyltransferase/amino-acid N-acetyltransferase
MNGADAATRSGENGLLLRRPVLPAGFRLAGVASGVKRAPGRGAPPLDLALVVAEERVATAGVFTTNRFAAAPVQICRDHLERSMNLARAIVVNSGCANAATGPEGLARARAVAAAAATLLGCRTEEVLVTSTGVIGRPLPHRRIVSALPAAVRALDGVEGLAAAARAILTTDTRPKVRSARAVVGGRTVTVTGFAKGSGMIHPRMATMLAFILTDAAVHPYLLRRLLQEAARDSFNAISVDGDCSTNDTVLLLANGAAGGRALLQAGPRERPFVEALRAVCRALALDIVADGEGARRLLEITVEGARTDADSDRIARAVANSPLVKTALAGGDPNWGRILSAAGAAGVRFDPSEVTLEIAGLPLVRDGHGTGRNGATLRRLFTAPRVAVRLGVGPGRGRATLWTCDLTKRYVDINARYTT